MKLLPLEGSVGRGDLVYVLQSRKIHFDTERTYFPGQEGRMPLGVTGGGMGVGVGRRGSFNAWETWPSLVHGHL